MQTSLIYKEVTTLKTADGLEILAGRRISCKADNIYFVLKQVPVDR